jgi:putative oxidoreductase
MMLDTTTPLLWPELGEVYQRLLPWGWTILRAVVGLALVPHGLRLFYGFFKGTGSRLSNFTELTGMLQSQGYRPARLCGTLIWSAEFVAGPLLVLGLFTRPAALVCCLFLLVSAWEHARMDGYFWNRLGLEYPLVWAAGTLPFLFGGGGPFSLDRQLLGWQF